jgi:transposase
MISNQQSLNLSPFMAIYDMVVPKDNMLRQINDLVDFSFVHEELQHKYCLENGRNAVPPIRMFKYLLLKSIFDVSDVDVVERSKYDMSFKYFLDMAVEIALKKEIIKSSAIIVDATHTKARFNQLSPKEILMQKSKF